MKTLEQLAEEAGGEWNEPGCQWEFGAMDFNRFAALVRAQALQEFEGEVRSFDLLMLPPQTQPVYLALRSAYAIGSKYGDHEHKKFFYESHSCPTNWLRGVELLSCGGDHDPHGLLKFVRSAAPIEPADDEEEMQPEDWEALFPEIRPVASETRATEA